MQLYWKPEFTNHGQDNYHSGGIGSRNGYAFYSIAELIEEKL